jgi:hypothetical protein
MLPSLPPCVPYKDAAVGCLQPRHAKRKTTSTTHIIHTQLQCECVHMYTTAARPAYHWRTMASWAFLSSVTAFPLALGYCWGTPAESREWEGRGERGLEHVQRQDIRENTCTREHIHTHTHTHTRTHAHTHTPHPAQPASGVALRLPARARRHGRPR